MSVLSQNIFDLLGEDGGASAPAKPKAAAAKPAAASAPKPAASSGAAKSGEGTHVAQA